MKTTKNMTTTTTKLFLVLLPLSRMASAPQIKLGVEETGENPVPGRLGLTEVRSILLTVTDHQPGAAVGPWQ